MKTLKELYSSLENKSSFDIMENYQISKEFQALSEKYKQKKYKAICKWENFVWDFYLEDGVFKPHSSWTQKDGSIYEYPSFENDINKEEVISYLGERSKTVKSHLLISRYNHILWQSKFKHRDFAINSIEAYLQLIRLETTTSENLKKISKAIISIAFQAKFKIEQVINEIEQLILNERLENSDANLVGDFIIKNYKSSNFNKLLKTLYKDNEQRIDKTNLESFYLPYLCDYNIELGKKLKLNFKNFHIKKAEHYINIIETETSRHKQHFYFKAILEYEKAGEQSKLDELYVLLENSKDEIRMGSIRKEFSSKEIQDVYKAIEYRADKITDYKANEIYDFLATNSEILPKSASFYEKSKPTFLDMVSSTSFDINKNFISGEEAKDHLNLYGMQLNSFSIRELFLIFQKGTIKNKISYSSLITYLFEKSWIGKNYPEKDYDGNKVEHNLISTLAPSLFDFFNQFEGNIKSKQFNNTAFILCTDSLTLKIEGLIRHFAKIIRCPTLILNKRKNGTRQRYIEEIVTHETFKKYFEDDDIVFILYLLTNKGMNIRNNVAHSFYRYENYSVSLAILLITLVLRLSKFDFNIEK